MPIKDRPLGKKLFAFAVISDTHVNPGEDHCNSPFPVNGRANRRFRHVVGELNQRDIEFVVHLGDLVHPVPETGALYAQAAEAYRNIESELKVPVHRVPGNHDIGDTPITGGPAHPLTPEMIEAWNAEFGDQYQAFKHGGLTYILLNAQLMNSGLPEEEEQKLWLEQQLADLTGRCMIMLHHPPYLCQPDEPNHYDNTDPPARDWLLDLLEKHGVEAMFAGHAHNFWYNRYNETDYYLAPSTSFVRQDYSEMLRVTPPEDSEFGRDDRAKLGYFVVTVYENGHAVQFARTFGEERAPDAAPSTASALAIAPRANDNPRLGFDLRQNWAELCEVPPSGGLDEFDRKLVRNDYHLLALIEMGVRDIRIPLWDLRDNLRRERLKALVHLGMRPTLFSFGVPTQEELALVEASRDELKDWEITINWSSLDELTEALDEINSRTCLPIYVSRMRSKDDLESGSVYFHVINHGFSAADGDMLAELAPRGFVGAVFRLGQVTSIAEALQSIEAAAAEAKIGASVHMRMGGDNPAEAGAGMEASVERLNAVVLAADTLPNTRVACDTLVSVDRGYFVRTGALDPCCNPTKIMQAVSALHPSS